MSLSPGKASDKTMASKQQALRNLVIVFGDSLDPNAAAFDGFDAAHDAVWMAEVAEECTHVWAHKKRIAVFFAAMRHFRDELRGRGVRVHYRELPNEATDDDAPSFSALLQRELPRLSPQHLVVTHPGDYRVLQELQTTAKALAIALDVRPDRHFFETPQSFLAWDSEHPGAPMETFYRHMRTKHEVLVTAQRKPEGGSWNFDKENRASFGRVGPQELNEPPRFAPSQTTNAVVALVEHRFGSHPGRIGTLDLPLTPAQAQTWLDDFITHRLPSFGKFEDAMWSGQPVLYHSRLSFLLNLKLIDPRTCVDAATAAYHIGNAPLAAVEGFVRQIVGWREYVRGIYWTRMPAYAHLNALDCSDRDVPSFFWDGRTRMACVADSMMALIDEGYTHHIVRLMVLGLFALLLGVHPRKFHEWHMAMYLDAIDWVSLPNALGMSQYGDGGIIGTKPYAASANYINRMSNHCGQCVYDPKQSLGEKACPFNSLYYDFLARHEDRLAKNPRMTMQMRNMSRKTNDDLVQLRRKADETRDRIDSGREV